MFFKEEIVILSFMYCFWRNTPTYLPTYLPTYWSYDFSVSYSTCSKGTGTKSMKSNGNIYAEWAKIHSFVWEKALFHIEVKFSYN